MSSKLMRVILSAAWILVAANVFFYLYVAKPLARRVQDLGELERMRQEQVAGEKKAHDDLVARKAALEATLADVAYFYDHVVAGEKEGYERVRRALQKLSEDTGTSIGAIGYATESRGSKQIETMSFSFSITGSYDQIRRFLSGIERSEVFLCVDSVDLTSSGSEEDHIALNIRLSTLIRKQA